MTSIQRAGRGWLAAGFAILCLACDGTDDDDGPTGNTGSITIVVGPATASIQPGSSTFVTVTLTRAGGFTGTVTVTIAGLPNGVTATMAPAQLTGNAVTSRIDLTAAATAALASATVTVSAAAQGVTTATASFQLAVTAPPDYAMVVSPATLTIAAGGTGNVDLQINRTNFSGPITLALLNPAAGITATFNPASATAATSAMALNVAATVAPGSYQVTIQGTATGVSSRSVAVTVTVVPPPPSGNNVAYYFCHVDDVPAFFAYQDGSGAWQSVTGVSSGGTTTFSFNITQGRGATLSVYQYSAAAVARVTGRMSARRMNRTATMASRFRDPRGAGRRAPGRSTALTAAAVGDLYETYVLYGSTTELAQDGLDVCGQAEPTKTVRATVTGVAPGQYGVVSLGSVTRIVDGATFTNPVTLDGVLPGPQDLVGSRISTPGLAPDKLVIFRNLNIPDQGSLPSTIDFNSPTSLVPATATATISGAATGDRLEIFVGLLTANGSGLLWNDLAPSTVAARPWAGLNSANMISGDLHHLFAFASRSTDLVDFRVVSKTVGAVSNQALALGAELNAPTASMVSAGAYPRFRFQGALAAGYNKRVSIDVLGEEDGSSALYIVTSVAYLGLSGTPEDYDITMPDVAGLPGFPLEARLTTGTNVVTLSAKGFTGSGLYEPRPIPGYESKELYKARRINVP